MIWGPAGGWSRHLIAEVPIIAYTSEKDFKSRDEELLRSKDYQKTMEQLYRAGATTWNVADSCMQKAFVKLIAAQMAKAGQENKEECVKRAIGNTMRVSAFLRHWTQLLVKQKSWALSCAAKYAPEYKERAEIAKRKRKKSKSKQGDIIELEDTQEDTQSVATTAPDSNGTTIEIDSNATTRAPTATHATESTPTPEKKNEDR